MACHTSDPWREEGVDDACDRTATSGESGDEVGQVPGCDLLGLGHEMVELWSVIVIPEAVVVAIGVGKVGDEAIFDFLVEGGGGREHAAVGGDGGGEGDAGAVDLREAGGEVEGGIDVALDRVSHQQEVLLIHWDDRAESCNVCGATSSLITTRSVCLFLLLWDYKQWPLCSLWPQPRAAGKRTKKNPKSQLFF